MNQQKNLISDKTDNFEANKITIGLLIIYLIVLVWILLFKLGVQFNYMEERIVSLIPFHDLFIPDGEIDIAETILNIVVFVPLGIYTGMLFEKWTIINKIFIFFIFSLMLEGLQFMLKIGAFDSTDIITNTLGGMIGLLIVEAIEKAFNNRAKTQKFINIIFAIGTGLIITLLSLLKLNMLPIKYH